MNVKRWKPDARRRLQNAALALFTERGFAATTTAAIAAGAGLTERTFFRHFADKRNVLYGDEAMLQAVLVQGIIDAPTSATPIAAATTGFAALVQVFQPRWDRIVQREKIIANSPELQERELVKVRNMTAAVRDALHSRGCTSIEADVAAETSVGLFALAFRQWTSMVPEQNLHELFKDVLHQLGSLMRGSGF